MLTRSEFAEVYAAHARDEAHGAEIVKRRYHDSANQKLMADLLYVVDRFVEDVADGLAEDRVSILKHRKGDGK